MIFRIIGLKGRKAFTVVELLTVLAVMGILVALLIPALNMVRDAAVNARQRAQFHSIEIALEAFRSDFGDYPPSESAFDTDYCAAQKLAEAVVGQDGFGVHPQTLFNAAGEIPDPADPTATIPLYYPGISALSQAEIDANLKSRKGPYLELEVANAVKLNNIYGAGNTGTMNGDTFILADMFGNAVNKATNNPTGLPILYFKADTLVTAHDASLYVGAGGDPETNIYDIVDNYPVFNLFVLGTTDVYHPMQDDTDGYELFYATTVNPNFTSPIRPYRAESFILMSAGKDGLYGTVDDVFNFEKQ